MNLKSLNISFLIVFLIFTLGVSISMGAVPPNHKATKTPPSLKAQEILYRIMSSIDIESLKKSLAQINLHMREGSGSVRTQIKIVIHGEAAKYFYAKNIDTEIKYMLDWFLAEDVKFSICDICMETFGIDMNALPEGFLKTENE